MVNNIVRTVWVITQISLSFILIPFMLYLYYSKFRDIRSSIMMQKRHIWIFEYQFFFMILWFISGYPLMITDFAVLDQLKGNNQTIISHITAIMWPFATFGYFICIAWRFWHIYFELKYSSSQRNSEWKYHLDPSLVEHNFWLTHKKDYGTPRWTRKICIIGYIIGVIPTALTYQFVINTDYFIIIGHGVASILQGFWFTIIFVLWFKMPSYNDNFFIKKELRIIGIPFCCTAPLFWIAAAIFFSDIAVVSSLGEFLMGALFFSSSIISLWYIPKKIRREELKNKLFRLNLKITQEESVILSAKQHRDLYSLHAVLLYDKTFKVFMQHLAKEFSTECLVCLCEMLQFKFYIKKRFDIINPNAITTSSNFDEHNWALCDVAPLSYIVRHGFQKDLSKYKLNDDETTLIIEIKNVCLELYNKYIKIGSELETNISYEMRSRLINVFDDKKFWMKLNINTNELFTLFDDTVMEMFRLMESSFHRFQQNDVFKDVCKMLDEIK